MNIKSALTLLTALSGLASLASGDALNSFVQTNLVSDLPGVAAQLDPNLVNPWGIVAGPTSPFWISDNGTGLSTLYDGTGAKLPLVVTIPPSGSAPTGVVFNGTTSFTGAPFIFATENGTIASWSGGASATTVVPATAGSVYKGLALGNNGSGDLLYAANFGLGRVDVFNSSFSSTSVSGGFKDTSLPAGYAPFDIQNLNGKLYVTYALQDPAHHDDVAGLGHGFIDVFDFNGNMLQRLTSQGSLNSPWGLALAPSGFGSFGGDLLVGNFGDGLIHAYNASSGAFLGTLDDTSGNPLAIQGLWGLSFGNGAHSQGLNTLFFTAGIPGDGMVEDHGLYGAIDQSPEPASAALLICGLLAGVTLRLRRRASAKKLPTAR